MITSILHVAPLLAIFVPLLLGRYPGEEGILSRRRRRADTLAVPARLNRTPPNEPEPI